MVMHAQPISNLNRLETAVREMGAVDEETDYGYDSADNLTAVTDANGNTTSYTYDDAGRLLLSDSPDTGVTRYIYDPAGNLTYKQDARGEVTRYAYDEANRITGITYDSDPSLNVTYEYDLPTSANGQGRLCRMTDSTGVTVYHYDTAGRVTDEVHTTMGIDYVTSYGYYTDGSLASVTYPTGRVVTFNRDVTGAITSATSDLGGAVDTIISSTVPHPFGGYDSVTYGNGMVNSFGYDLNGRLETLASDSFLSRSYQRLAGGDIYQINDLVNPLSYSYDLAGRLTMGSGSFGSVSYTYDEVGNRLEKTTGVGTTNYSYVTGTNRLDAATGPEAADFDHGPAGNMTNSGSLSMVYDASGRLREISDGSTLKGRYFYNGQGQRVIKDECRVYVYDLSGNMIGEYLTDGTLVAEIIYADGIRVAEYRDANADPVCTPYQESMQSFSFPKFFLARGGNPPRVYSVDPSSGSVFGGGVVTVWGHRFDEASTVQFGAVEATNVTYVSSGELTVTTPAHPEGVVDVTVTNPDLQSGVLVNGFTFIPPSNPLITSLDPDSGDVDGGEMVTIWGDQFDATPSVLFGLEPSPNVTFVSSQELTVATPPMGDCTVDVTVTNPDLGSFTLANGFSYINQSNLPKVQLHFYHNDHLSTPLYLTDDSGTVVWEGRYYPFGDIYSQNTDPDGDCWNVYQPFRFPGQYEDAETGLYYNYFRDYDPQIGRYVEADPIGLRGGINLFAYVDIVGTPSIQTNLYLYTGADPINHIDPLGLFRYSPTAGDPVNNTTARALECFDTCAGQEVVVTAGQEGGHTPGSAHETGQACDLGTNSNPWLNRDTAERCFNECFDQTSSYGQEESNHFHFQTRPGRGGTTGFAPGVR